MASKATITPVWTSPLANLLGCRPTPTALHRGDHVNTRRWALGSEEVCRPVAQVLISKYPDHLRL